MGSDKLLQNTDFSGPALGVVFRFQAVREWWTRRRLELPRWVARAPEAGYGD